MCKAGSQGFGEGPKKTQILMIVMFEIFGAKRDFQPFSLAIFAPYNLSYTLMSHHLCIVTF